MKNQKWWILTLSLIVVCPILFYVLDCVFEFNRGIAECDLQTGRRRYTSYLFGIKLREQMWETALSRALTPEDLTGKTPDWRITDTYVTGKSGLHSRRFYHFMTVSHFFYSYSAHLDQAARRQVSLTMLNLMQTDGNTSAAEDFVNRLSLLTDKGTLIHAADLPSSRSLE